VSAVAAACKLLCFTICVNASEYHLPMASIKESSETLIPLELKKLNALRQIKAHSSL